MTKRHFAFVSMPGVGHVNPTLPVVAELVRRGHRVTYLTGAGFADMVTATGATFVPSAFELPAPPGNADFGPERMAGVLRMILAQARTDLPAMLDRFGPDTPDAVCYDAMTMTGRMLAGKLGVADVALMPSFAANERFSLFAEMTKDVDFANPALRAVLGELNELHSAYGVPTRQANSLMGQPASLNIVFIPREFQLAADTFDDRFRFVGPSLGDRASDDDWQPPPGGEPVLYVSLGTAFNDRPEFFRMCLDAFTGSGWRVAMSVGSRIDVAALGAIPADFDVRPYFPQPAVLRHASAFLSHAGMNSTMESLYFGVPLVAVPQMPEQEANARRAEELGVGKRLDAAELSAELLRTTVDKIGADTGVRANLDEIRAVVRNCGGALAAADALEEHLNEQ